MKRCANQKLGLLQKFRKKFLKHQLMFHKYRQINFGFSNMKKQRYNDQPVSNQSGPSTSENTSL